MRDKYVWIKAANDKLFFYGNGGRWEVVPFGLGRAVFRANNDTGYRFDTVKSAKMFVELRDADYA